MTVLLKKVTTYTPNSEFYNSLKHRVTTVISIILGQYHGLSFRLEGNSVTQLGHGTLVQKKCYSIFLGKIFCCLIMTTCLRNSDTFNYGTNHDYQFCSVTDEKYYIHW